MKSPIKYVDDHTICLSHLKSIIPKKSIVNSFLFFSGAVEFNLSQSGYFVHGHTDRYVIYEFWSCMMNDPKTVYDLVTCESFERLRNKKTCSILQKNWPRYKDPYIRSALFFMLNRLSSTGMLSSGEFVEDGINPICLTYLQNFKTANFHLSHVEQSDISEIIFNNNKCDYILIPAPRYTQNLIDGTEMLGIESTKVNHKKMFETLKKIDSKFVILYDYAPDVFKVYKDYNIAMINRFGKTTNINEKCEKLIVTNF